MITNLLIAITAGLLSAVCWLLSLIGLPGNWGIVVIAGLLAAFAPDEASSQVHWGTVGILLALAGAGELLEFLAGAAGVGQTGGSRRAVLLALVGSVLGAMIGLFVGLPVPIVGGFVGSILFSGLGAALGAIVGQRWARRHWHDSVQLGWGAFRGRIMGTVAKSLCGGMMLIVLLFALVF